jgi:hypothetical protein
LALFHRVGSRVRVRFSTIKDLVEALYGSVDLALACRGAVIGRFVQGVRWRRKSL